jgi:hypothetical protein
MSPGNTNPFARLHNLATNPSESTYYNSQQPGVVADLVRELTLWEAQLTKPEWGPLGIRNKNEFDHFVYRADIATAGVWSTSGAWLEAETTNAVQLKREDAYANAVLEFGTRNDADYIATNDMRRATGYTFLC